MLTQYAMAAAKWPSKCPASTWKRKTATEPEL